MKREPCGFVVLGAMLFIAVSPTLGAATSVKPGETPAVAIETVGEPKLVYRWETDKCEDEFIPDAPARAFRRADGKVTLIATHRENWSLVGTDLQSLAPSCRSLLRSSLQPRSAGNLWIEATHTDDGRNVVALVSQSLTKLVDASKCSSKASEDCWLNRIVAARSTDMGETFSLYPEEERAVASIGDYPAGGSGRYGVFTVSNIVRRKAHLYAIAFVRGAEPRKRGNCLLRTSDSSSPRAWRAWDGKGFDGRLDGSGSASCRVLTNLRREVRSLSYLQRASLWVAVYSSREKLPGDPAPVAGFYYSTSADMLRWSKPGRIAEAPTVPRRDSTSEYWAYPSLIDPDSTSKNFDTVGGEGAALFFTRIHLRRGNGTMNRDLYYIPLSIGHLRK